MAANHVIAQVVMPRSTGLPADVITNTFHFSKTPADDLATVATELMAALTAFYNTGTNPVGTFIGPTVSRTAAAIQVKWYDGSLPEGARVPDTRTFTLATASGTTSLPSEVAVCLSFRSTASPAVARARKRGRIYLGPINSSGTAGSPTVDLRPSPALLTALRDAGKALANASVLAGHPWCVYSPTQDDLFQITHVWTDDAFDTQRRRGIPASSRVELAA